MRASIKETLDDDFRSAGDDNPQPGCLCSRVGQSPQDAKPTPNVATLIKCINNKDQCMRWVARKGADEIKKERVFHGLWCHIGVNTEMFCHNASKSGENYCEFGGESRKDISGLIQIWVISPAEKGSGKLFLFVKSFRDRMSQRRLANSGQAVDPVCIAFIFLRRFSGCPGNYFIQEKPACAFHTAELSVIAGVDVLEPFEQKLLIYMRPLRMNYRRIETISTYRPP